MYSKERVLLNGEQADWLIVEPSATPPGGHGHSATCHHAEVHQSWAPGIVPVLGLALNFPDINSRTGCVKMAAGATVRPVSH